MRYVGLVENIDRSCTEASWGETYRPGNARGSRLAHARPAHLHLLLFADDDSSISSAWLGLGACDKGVSVPRRLSRGLGARASAGLLRGPARTSQLPPRVCGSRVRGQSAASPTPEPSRNKQPNFYAIAQGVRLLFRGGRTRTHTRARARPCGAAEVMKGRVD